MQGGFVTVVLAAASSACGFSPTTTPADARPPVDSLMVDAVEPVTWSVDSTSTKAVPISAQEWSDLIAARTLTISAPDHLWLAQESSGTLIDSIGGIVLGPIGSVVYRRAVAGWDRVGVGTIDTGTNIGFATTNLGKLDGTSYALLVYVMTMPSSSVRPLAGIGANSDHRTVSVTPASLFEADGLGGVTPSTGTVPSGPEVHPLVMVIDATHTTYAVYSDHEVMSPPWIATNGGAGLLSIGSAAFGASASTYLYAALWSGSKAELSATQVAGMLRGLGWTVTGY